MGLTGYFISAPIGITVLLFSSNLSGEIGLGLHHFSLSPIIKTLLSLVALDFSLYLWHRMNHFFEFLWRFHAVHHIDTEMDSGTAFRFHFGELILSSLYRSAVILALGIGIKDLLLFEIIVTSCAIFHHSNIALPYRFESALSKVMITPLIHQLHHSRVRKELDSNYGALTTLWDKLCLSYTPVKRELVRLGVPKYNAQDKQGILNLLKMPFSDECKN